MRCSAATAAAESAAEAAEDRLAGGGSAVELDEFGRDINVMARSESARRKTRLERSYARWQVSHGQSRMQGSAELCMPASYARI